MTERSDASWVEIKTREKCYSADFPEHYKDESKDWRIHPELFTKAQIKDFKEDVKISMWLWRHTCGNGEIIKDTKIIGCYYHKGWYRGSDYSRLPDYLRQLKPYKGLKIPKGLTIITIDDRTYAIRKVMSKNSDQMESV